MKNNKLLSFLLLSLLFKVVTAAITTTVYVPCSCGPKKDKLRVKTVTVHETGIVNLVETRTTTIYTSPTPTTTNLDKRDAYFYPTNLVSRRSEYLPLRSIQYLASVPAPILALAPDYDDKSSSSLPTSTNTH